MKLSNMLLAVLLLFVYTSCNPEDLLGKKKGPEVGDIQADDSDLIVQIQDTVNLWIEANDPEGGTLSYAWTKSGGEFLGSISKSSVKWVAPTVGGTFNISVSVTNEAETVSQQTRIIVQSPTAPYVKILAPQNDAFIVQGSQVTINAEAVHANGLAQLSLYVRDALVKTISGHSDSEYEITWIAAESSGPAELKIVGLANITGAVGADSINVNIEGVIPGKK